MNVSRKSNGGKKNGGFNARRLGSDSLILVAMLAAILVAALAVVWPLWLLATKATPVYTALCIALAAGALALFIVSRVRAKKKASSW